MDTLTLIPEGVKVWFLIPLLICCARILDVSIGTVRVISVARGMKLLSAVLGFFEVLIWLVAIGQILQNLTHWQNYIGYATGFALGNFIGISIEQRLAFGTVILRLIFSKDPTPLIEELRANNYGVTAIDAEGRDGPVKILLMLVPRNQLGRTLEVVEKYHPRAFYAIEDVRSVKEGVFPISQSSFSRKQSFARKLFRLTK